MKAALEAEINGIWAPAGAADKARARVRGDLAAPSRPPPESAEARAARAFRPQALAGRETLAPQLQMAGLSLQPGVQPGMQPGVQQQLGGMGPQLGGLQPGMGQHGRTSAEEGSRQGPLGT